MREILYFCDECKKKKPCYKIRIKIEKLDKSQKEKGWAINKGIFCKKCTKYILNKLDDGNQKDGE